MAGLVEEVLVRTFQGHLFNHVVFTNKTLNESFALFILLDMSKNLQISPRFGALFLGWCFVGVEFFLDEELLEAGAALQDQDGHDALQDFRCSDYDEIEEAPKEQHLDG